jgi:NAD-specific glutamate dehydrogenase.
MIMSVLIETIRKRRSGRLINDAHHIQPGDTTGVARRLTLTIVEVGREP